MEYISVFIYLIFLIYIYDINGDIRYKKTNNIFLFIIFVILAGLRYRLAPDSITYEAEFELEYPSIINLNLSDFTNSRYQPFWIILNSFCKLFDNFVVLQIFASFICNITIFYFISKSTTKIFTGYLFYFLFDYLYFTMDIMRESIAVGLFLVGMVKYNNNKIYSCYLFLFFAFMIHFYAAFSFLIPIYLSSKISYKFKLLIPFVLVIILIVFDNPTMLIAQMFLANSVLSELGLNYYAEQFIGDINYSGYIYMILKIVPVCLILIIYRNRKYVPCVLLNIRVLYGLSIIYVFIILIRMTSIPFIERFSNYFVIVIHILIIGALYDFISKYRNTFVRFSILITIVSIGFIYYFLPYVAISNEFGVPLYKRYYPYYSVFSKKTDKDRETIIYQEGRYF